MSEHISVGSASDENATEGIIKNNGFWPDILHIEFSAHLRLDNTMASTSNVFCAADCCCCLSLCFCSTGSMP